MTTLVSLLCIFLFCLAGQALAVLAPFPLPGSVVSMALILIALWTGRVRRETIGGAGDFLLSNMGLFFVPSSVELIETYVHISGKVPAFLIVIFLSTFITYGATALTVSAAMRWQEKRRRARGECTQ